MTTPPPSRLPIPPATPASASPARREQRARRRFLMIATAACALAIGVVVLTQISTLAGGAGSALIKLPAKVEAWAAITLAVSIQALPFLALGVVVSAIVTAFVPADFLRSITPRNPFFAVPLATLAGVGLPGCECASVPVAQSFMRAGVSKAAAIVFMLASPALNPVVVVSTAVAFYANPQMVWARFIASFFAVLLAGWLWIFLGRDRDIRIRGGVSEVGEGAAKLAGADGGEPGAVCVSAHATSDKKLRWITFQETALHDLTHAGGFLILGAMIAGVIKVVIPAQWFFEVSARPWLAVAVMAGFAIVLSLCSEADAFVAASFTAVSPTAQLAFLVVGPMVDIKLISMQAGCFGMRFVKIFVPLALICALLAATITGSLFFGSL